MKISFIQDVLYMEYYEYNFVKKFDLLFKGKSKYNKNK